MSRDYEVTLPDGSWYYIVADRPSEAIAIAKADGAVKVARCEQRDDKRDDFVVWTR